MMNLVTAALLVTLPIALATCGHHEAVKKTSRHGHRHSAKGTHIEIQELKRKIDNLPKPTSTPDRTFIFNPKELDP